jgi:uncharacterized membrane protein YfcA
VTEGVLPLLMLAAFTAGFIDAIAGGGGLVTVPALLAAGLPPHIALGTNKGQAIWGTAAALANFARRGWIDRRTVPGRFAAGFVGSCAGAALVLVLSPEVLRPVVLVLLVAVAAVLAFRPTVEPTPRPRTAAAGVAIALALGLYDGFFGPGMGTFLVVGFVLVLGHTLTRATAEAKVVNFASNLAALGVFTWQGTVLWSVALPMAAAQLVGGLAGSQVALRGGDRLVRRVLLGVVAALVAKLAWDATRG